MLTSTPMPICESSALVDCGTVVKFIEPGGKEAFVVRWKGAVYGYINDCAHAGGPLDFEGEVLESSGRFLMCARHGAIYEPNTGKCAGGPCRGGGLTPVAVAEGDDGKVCLQGTNGA